MYYPDGFFSYAPPDDCPKDPMTITRPTWAERGVPIGWEVVEPARFARFRSFTASR